MEKGGGSVVGSSQVEVGADFAVSVVLILSTRAISVQGWRQTRIGVVLRETDR